MLEFIVLGQIPGTRITLSWSLYLLVVAALAVVVLFATRWIFLRRYSKLAKQMALDLISL